MKASVKYVPLDREFSEILYEKRDGSAWITINRPEIMNILTYDLVLELTAAFEDVERDQTIGVCVLTAAGERVFNAGGDIDMMNALDHVTGQVWNNALMKMSTIMRNMRVPIILAANGYCIGGGNELNIFCDMTIAAEHAKFGQAGPKVGACPVWGATQMLPRIVGEKKAREMIMMCNIYTAQEALEMGLVNKVVPYADLYTETQKWCDTILDRSPQSIRIAKVSLNFESDLMYPSLMAGSVYLSYIWGSDQVHEGFNAFKEKRKPNWRQFRKNAE
ncbi:enoyl-CoA hydratase-related protein [Desulfosporosinus sp.]|uniref:enoyl-CoA hydratase-related protein n=1 Tax=Desulfosporosinus sp. TaxID=157907 RepID=UPI00232306C3|nr:enoyl-CoA hydratase-related protein [Desulfosporosinus sp.]MDA8224038.1 enoyl-CoA hydratase-related protein [Desulfitobacterium hafniense]